MRKQIATKLDRKLSPNSESCADPGDRVSSFAHKLLSYRRGPGQWDSPADIRPSEVVALVEELDTDLIARALLIRRTEETLLELFSRGLINGTIHTCVGQEFSAVAFAGQLSPGDFVFSNHRCHGHYIAFSGDCRGLIAELMGKSTGVCGGIGGSQHLCAGGFFSNGIQGGITPVAAGMALANKMRRKSQIGVVYIGDGTLAQGVVYETMNIVSAWKIPLLFVCENNYYAQSTPQHVNLAGDILNRAAAFGVKAFRGNTWSPADLVSQAGSCINNVRATGAPAFFLVDTYRLNPHSKGDDTRDIREVSRYEKTDPLNLFADLAPKEYTELKGEIDARIHTIVEQIESEPDPDTYSYLPCIPAPKPPAWKPLASIAQRQAKLINAFFMDQMARDESLIFIGEDVADPYGGAFKISRNLSQKYPDRVLTTPISEQAIAGVANGLALAGFRPYLEIMFGDFVTLALDQIINHASKFHHMYNRQVNCPIVIRTPMGGRRGYGPTHSQTLDRFLVGIDNVKTIALNTLTDPRKIYEAIHRLETHPVIVIENKTDYTRKIHHRSITNFRFEQSDESYPVVRVRPLTSAPTVTIVAYGGAAGIVIEAVDPIFEELDHKPEVIIPTQISPVDIKPIVESVQATNTLVVVEEGPGFAGIGSELIASVVAAVNEKISTARLAAAPVPIPAARTLEDKVLPAYSDVVEAIRRITA